MTTRHINTFQRIAMNLPRYRQYATRQLSGAELLDMGYTEWNGAAVEADRSYAVELVHETNQVRQLIRLYRAQGAKAVRRMALANARQLTSTL